MQVMRMVGGGVGTCFFSCNRIAASGWAAVGRRVVGGGRTQHGAPWAVCTWNAQACGGSVSALGGCGGPAWADRSPDGIQITGPFRSTRSATPPLSGQFPSWPEPHQTPKQNSTAYPQLRPGTAAGFVEGRSATGIGSHKSNPAYGAIHMFRMAGPFGRRGGPNRDLLPYTPVPFS